MTVTRPAPPRAAPPSTTPTAPKFGRIPAGNINGVAIVLNAVEGFGKTSTGAGAPKPAILMSRGETGFVTLRKAGRVPDCDAVELSTWNATLKITDDLAASEHETIVVDAMGGFERLCHEHVCLKDFDGDWGEKGFTGFMRGYEIAIPSWLQFLQRLDVLRAKGKNILMLSHARAKSFKNPLGPDFDRYIADVHEKTWGVTCKWADAVLFGTYVTVTQEKRGGRAKGIGGTERIIYTQRTDGYDAKNRYGMPPQLQVPEDPAEMWPLLWNNITGKAQPDAIVAAEAMPEL